MIKLWALPLILAAFIPVFQEIITDEASAAEFWRSFSRLRTELGFRPIEANPDLAAWAFSESRSRSLAAEAKDRDSRRAALDEAAQAAGLVYKKSVVVSLEMPSLDITLFRDMLLTESNLQGQRLWGDFDIGGLGIVSSGSRHYVTIGLLSSIAVIPVLDAAKKVRTRIDTERSVRKLSSIAWKSEYIKEAQIGAERAAAGSAFDFAPPNRRHAFFVKWETTDLVPTDKVREEYLVAFLRQGGIGVVFGRTPQYPGGRYLVSLLLITKPYTGVLDD